MGKARKPGRRQSAPTPPRGEVAPRPKAEELRSAGRRAGLAKAISGAVAALVFGAAMVFARHSYPGHPKRPVTPLAAPRSFVNIVRQNLLQAGVVAPPQAPPGATTSVS